ncbi:MAG: DoxX family membrane protein [Candidatus Omnitrophica bacterium]|nr:DoxX family membrane protein [Candidatus Omnitrophota bacterium]
MVLLSMLRIGIGVLLAVSGFFKLIEPYQNFAASIEVYEILSVSQAQIVARILPWAELFTGIFLIAGLWLKGSMISAWLMFTSFIAVVGQAMIRKLPIESCGCFGDGVHLPPWLVFGMDTCVWILLSAGIRNPSLFSRLSIENKDE